MKPASPILLGVLLQRYFIERLMQQLNASSRTIAAYRDCFKLLLEFLKREIKKPPTEVTLQDLSAPRILKFLNYLENERNNSIRTRNARFAAVRSFMNYVASDDPTTLAIVQPVLAIGNKRFERKLVGSLPRKEVEQIINAPNKNTWIGQRDRVMFATLYNTGARVSELTAMRVADISLATGPGIHIFGKGRKLRQVPLWRETALLLKNWLAKYPRKPEDPLFTSRSGRALTRVGVARRLKLAAAQAAKQCPTLAKRRVHPHLIRHSLAMHLLQKGVSIDVIALWLGHEGPEVTHMYLEADLQTKERTLRKLRAPKTEAFRYKVPDGVLSFLESL
jgi:integrase/recombinase XerD